MRKIAVITTIVLGICILIFTILHKNVSERTYPAEGNEVRKQPVTTDCPFKEKVIVNGKEIDYHKTVKEVTKEEAKKLRENAGYSSEGVIGGVIVGFEEIEHHTEK